jgi:tRNA pseudouridine55 synthase
MSASIHGVLLLDKPAGLSSNAALQRARRLFGWAKAGHTGTLDPLATGLLPVCFGEATKYSQGLLDADKCYEAQIHLGMTSSTGDAEGVLQQGSTPAFDRAQLQAVLNAFHGALTQVPPMHSAIKRNGQPLYKLARAGESVARDVRNILIKELEIIDFNNFDALRIRVTCSKGTYIRVLAEDIGNALGCGAFLAGLRRTRIARLDVQGATTLDELESRPPEARSEHLLPIDSLLADVPGVILDESSAQRLCQGLRASINGAQSGVCRLYGPHERFLGLGEVAADGTVTPKRMVSAPFQGASEGTAPRFTP